MQSATDSLFPLSLGKDDAEVWGIRLAGLMLVVLAMLTWNTASDTKDKVERQNQQIDALYNALQKEQQAKTDAGTLPVTPPADEIRKNPKLISIESSRGCGNPAVTRC